VKRRQFIAGLGSAAAWPLAVRAQQGDRMRRVGVTWKTFTRVLTDLGWTNGRNVQMDLRLHGDDINQIPALAQGLVGLQPDVILAGSTPATAALQRETRTIPIVFAGVADPVASGIVARLRSCPVRPAADLGRIVQSTLWARTGLPRCKAIHNRRSRHPCELTLSTRRLLG
jgi:putative ABC transport system substrate-binding protein